MKKKLFALLLSFAMLMNIAPPIGTIAVAAEDISYEYVPVHTDESSFAESVEGNEEVLDSENPYSMEETITSETITDEQDDVTKLYEAMYQETTLRGLFDLVNANTDVLVSFNLDQVYAFEALICDIEANTETEEMDEEALEQLLDNVEVLKDMLGYGTCWYCGQKEGAHTGMCTVNGIWERPIGSIPFVKNSTEEGSVFSDKSIVKDKDDNHAIQIDVYTEGVVSSVTTEIVLVVDQSGSMFQTSGNNKPYHPDTNPEGWMTYEQFIQYGDKEKAAKYPGYYMAMTNNVKYNTYETDHNNSSQRHREYAIAIVKYDEKNGWLRSNQIGFYQGDGSYDSLVVSPTWGGITEKNLGTTLGFSSLQAANYNKPPSAQNTRYPKGAKYYKSLYGATMDAYEAFIKEVSGIKNAKIAIVGFSSPESYGVDWNGKEGANYGGTGVIVDGEFVHGKDNPDYSKVWMTTESQEDIDKIYASFRQLFSNYNQTCTQDGFRLANKIFAESTETNANRVVLFFTDGEPTAHTDTPVGDNHVGVGYNEAIQESKLTKEKAAVYVFGPASLTNGNDNAAKFLQYLSSNYPNATAMDDSGAKANDSYYGIAGNAADLEKTFMELGQKIFEESNALNEKSEIRDTVTPYFDIGGEYNGGNIIVQKLLNTGNLDLDGNVIFDEENPVVLYDELNNIKNVILTRNNDVEYDQTLSDGSVVKRKGDQIIVSGYDYGKNTVYPGEARGAKLRLLIPIEPNDEFVGGNWANTNSMDSGLFPDNNPSSPPVGGDDGYFPPPHEDVEVKEDEVIEADVEARAGATYLEKIHYSELLKLVRLTIKDKDNDSTNDLVLQMGVPNYGVDEWKTDYVFIETYLYDTLTDDSGNLILDADGNPQKGAVLTGGDLSIRRDHAVIAEVYIWSRYTYDKVTGEPILQKQRPDNLEPATGTIYLSVYYPTFVFNDVTLYHGQPLLLATEAWGEEMDATKYLQWYTNSEYNMLLANPQPQAEAPGYVALPKGSWGTGADLVIPETPKVYFKVDPIDSTLMGNHTGAVDEHFYDKFGTYMGKEPVEMNVRVFYRNDGDTGSYDPDNPTGTADAMRNAFFLHVATRGNNIPKHTSGSSSSNDVYWGTEFRIIPMYCELTIEKVGGLPNETYIFTIARGQTNEYSLVTGEQIQYETDPVYYTTVSITTDASGYGKVILTEMPVGVYTVTEDMNWSWRFEDVTPTISWKYENGTVGTGTEIYLLGNADQDAAVVTITNSSPDDSWLSGMSAVVKNIFGKKKQ